jgi:hypothetical protein
MSFAISKRARVTFLVTKRKHISPCVSPSFAERAAPPIAPRGFGFGAASPAG